MFYQTFPDYWAYNKSRLYRIALNRIVHSICQKSYRSKYISMNCDHLVQKKLSDIPEIRYTRIRHIRGLLYCAVMMER